MPPPVTPWGARALEILSDGQWHSRAQLVDAMLAAVPPGVAFRQGEQLRASKARQHGYTFGQRTRGDDTTSIETGRRSKAVRQLRDLTRDRDRHGANPRVERATVDGVDSYRLAAAADLSRAV